MAPPCKGCQEVTLVGMVQNIFFLLVTGRIARSIQTSSSFQGYPPWLRLADKTRKTRVQQVPCWEHLFSPFLSTIYNTLVPGKQWQRKIKHTREQEMIPREDTLEKKTFSGNKIQWTEDTVTLAGNASVRFIQVSIDNVMFGVKYHSNEWWKRLEYSWRLRLWQIIYVCINFFMWANQLIKILYTKIVPQILEDQTSKISSIQTKQRAENSTVKTLPA